MFLWKGQLDDPVPTAFVCDGIIANICLSMFHEMNSTIFNNESPETCCISDIGISLIQNFVDVTIGAAMDAAIDQGGPAGRDVSSSLAELTADLMMVASALNDYPVNLSTDMGS